MVIAPNSVGPAPITDIEIFDQRDGTYIVRFVGTETASDFTISVRVNADDGSIKTSTLTVISNSTSPLTSTFSWDSWASPDPTKLVDLGFPYSFTTYLTDSYGNPIKEYPWTLLTEIEGQGQKQYSTASLSDLASGEYATTFTVPTSADRAVSLCGAYTLRQFLVQAGGLFASYYPNQWFSPYSQPYLQRVDPSVNFSWLEGEDIIPSIAREHVSVEWVGYLMPGQTGAYLFFAEADDGVRLFVDGVLLIDSM